MEVLKSLHAARRLLLTVFVLAMGFAGAAQADSIYLYVNGESQGVISTDASPGVQGHVDEITVFGFGHSIVLPRDAQSGQVMGQRQHQPFRIYKAFDKTSPKLYQALVNNEKLIDFDVKFLRVNRSTGDMEVYFTIEMEDAYIVDITSAGGTDRTSPREVISVTYRKIKWTYADGNVSAEDDWRTQQT